MKYSVLKVVNGSVAVLATNTSLQAIKVSFFDACKTLWNESSVTTGVLLIVDENLDPVEGNRYKEFISHPAQNQGE